MKTILIALLMIISANAMSAVLTSYDSQNDCTLYRIQNFSANDKIKKNESVYYEKDLYNFSLKDLEINFDEQEASALVVMNVVLGFNKNLFEQKVVFNPRESRNFNSILNFVNRKILAMDKICVRDNLIIYTEAETQKQ